MILMVMNSMIWDFMVLAKNMKESVITAITWANREELQKVSVN